MGCRVGRDGRNRRVWIVTVGDVATRLPDGAKVERGLVVTGTERERDHEQHRKDAQERPLERFTPHR